MPTSIVTSNTSAMGNGGLGSWLGNLGQHFAQQFGQFMNGADQATGGILDAGQDYPGQNAIQGLTESLKNTLGAWSALGQGHSPSNPIQILPVAGDMATGASQAIQGLSNPHTAAASAGALVGMVLGGGEEGINPVHELINARDSLYHATSIKGLEGILNTGELQESPTLSDGRRYLPLQGISTSRVPGPYTHANNPIHIVLDKSKVNTNPVAETGYGRTTSLMSYTPNSTLPNPAYEFEERTPGSSIPVSAIKGIVINKQALANNIINNPENYWPQGIPEPTIKTPSQLNALLDYHINQLKQTLQVKNIPMRVAENTRDLRTYRASFSKLKQQGSPLWGLAPVAGAYAASQGIKSTSNNQ